ncbi:MAG: lysostaphin resistance A-like protein [Lacipirellulaceae bacterium]
MNGFQPNAALGAVLSGLFLASLAVWLEVAKRLRRGDEVIEREPRERVPWGADGSVLAAVCLAAAAAGAAVQHVVNIDAKPILRADQSLLIDAAAMGLMYGVMAGAVAAWFAFVWRAHRGDFGFGPAPRGVARDVGLGFATVLAALAPVYAVQLALVTFVAEPTAHPILDRLKDDPVGGVIGAILLAVVIAPLFEEFAFRVLLQGWLEGVPDSPRAWWPIGVSAAAFALAHQGQGYAPAPLFVFALFLGYLYRQTHRLLPCVVAHAAFNAMSLAAVLALPTPLDGAP